MSVPKACGYCGKIILCKPSHFDKIRYCSKSCMAEDYKTRLAGDKNPNYRRAGARICEICKKIYFSYNKTRRYCSKKCFNLTRTRKPKVLLSPKIKPVRKMYSCKYCGEKSIHKRLACRACRKAHYVKKIYTSICSSCGSVVNKPYRKYCDECFRAHCTYQRGIPRRKDANQNEIVEKLEFAGASVLDLSPIGHGCPDILVLFDDTLYLFEVKNPAAKGKLNKLQKEWHKKWRGQVAVIYTAEDAFREMGGKPNEKENT